MRSYSKPTVSKTRTYYEILTPRDPERATGRYRTPHDTVVTRAASPNKRAKYLPPQRLHSYTRMYPSPARTNRKPPFLDRSQSAVASDRFRLALGIRLAALGQVRLCNSNERQAAARSSRRAHARSQPAEFSRAGKQSCKGQKLEGQALMRVFAH